MLPDRAAGQALCESKSIFVDREFATNAAQIVIMLFLAGLLVHLLVVG
jgi:hypothetical protein